MLNKHAFIAENVSERSESDLQISENDSGLLKKVFDEPISDA